MLVADPQAKFRAVLTSIPYSLVRRIRIDAPGAGHQFDAQLLERGGRDRSDIFGGAWCSAANPFPARHQKFLRRPRVSPRVRIIVAGARERNEAHIGFAGFRFLRADHDLDVAAVVERGRAFRPPVRLKLLDSRNRLARIGVSRQ